MRLKASYVVENAVIIPMFVIIIVTMIILCFYMHDVIIIKNTVVKLGIRTEFQKENVNVQEVQQLGAEYINEKTMYVKNAKIEIKNKFSNYTVIGYADFSSKLAFINNMSHIKKEAVVYKNKPDDFIRLLNAVKQ